MSDQPVAESPSAIVIAGPTASGKTALALEIAERFHTEIVSADSMQFYRGMEIGTAAPTPQEQARVRHHFVGFLNPNEEFSAGAYELAARDVIAHLNASGRPAVVVGGSGLYIRALVEGLFPGPGKDDAIRARLHEEARTKGVPALYARLQTLDADYASVIQPGDLRRIVRALEVYEVTGRALSDLHREHRESIRPLHVVAVGLDWPRDALYARIDARVDAMMEQGFAEEVRSLIAAGYEADIHRLRSLGYREIAAYLREESSLDDAVALMKRNTRRYAKRQLSWFRGEKDMHWLPVNEDTAISSLAEDVMRLASGGGTLPPP